MAQIKKIKKKRNIFRNKINELITEIKTNVTSENVDFIKLEDNLNQLENKEKYLKCLNADIEDMTELTDTETEYKESLEFNDIITEWKFRAHKKIEAIRKIKVDNLRCHRLMNNSQKENSDIDFYTNSDDYSDSKQIRNMNSIEVEPSENTPNDISVVYDAIRNLFHLHNIEEICNGDYNTNSDDYPDSKSKQVRTEQKDSSSIEQGMNSDKEKKIGENAKPELKPAASVNDRKTPILEKDIVSPEPLSVPDKDFSAKWVDDSRIEEKENRKLENSCGTTKRNDWNDDNFDLPTISDLAEDENNERPTVCHQEENKYSLASSKRINEFSTRDYSCGSKENKNNNNNTGSTNQNQSNDEALHVIKDKQVPDWKVINSEELFSVKENTYIGECVTVERVDCDPISDYELGARITELDNFLIKSDVKNDERKAYAFYHRKTRRKECDIRNVIVCVPVKSLRCLLDGLQKPP